MLPKHHFTYFLKALPAPLVPSARELVGAKRGGEMSFLVIDLHSNRITVARLAVKD